MTWLSSVNAYHIGSYIYRIMPEMGRIFISSFGYRSHIRSFGTVQVQMVGWSRAFWLMTWWQFFQIKLWFSRLEIVVYCDSGYLIRSSIQSWKDRFKLKLELLEGFWIFWLKDTYIFIIVRLGCFLEKFKSSPKNAFCIF